MNNRYVLDSFAILALINNEPGATRTEDLLHQAAAQKAEVAISLINWGEVAYILERRLGEEKMTTALAYLEAIPLILAEVNRNLVLAAAHIKATHSLSYADAFAAALTQERGATLLTGDPEFRSVAHLIAIEWLPTK